MGDSMADVTLTFLDPIAVVEGEISFSKLVTALNGSSVRSLG
jgi:hypothetical protein